MQIACGGGGTALATHPHTPAHRDKINATSFSSARRVDCRNLLLNSVNASFTEQKSGYGLEVQHVRKREHNMQKVGTSAHPWLGRVSCPNFLIIACSSSENFSL